MKEIVIKISDETYNECQADEGRLNIIWELVDAIRKGTPLPKGHGRLIDVKDLYITTITTDDYSGNEVIDVVLKEDVDNAPTIIEADKESEEV